MSSLTPLLASLFQGSSGSESLDLSDMQHAYGIIRKLYDSVDRQGVELLVGLAIYLAYRMIAQRKKDSSNQPV